MGCATWRTGALFVSVHPIRNIRGISKKRTAYKKCTLPSSHSRLDLESIIEKPRLQ